MMFDKPLSMVAISPHRARSPPRPWINFSALSFCSLHNFHQNMDSEWMQESSTKHNMNVKTYQVSGCTSRCCPPGLSSSSSWRQTHRSTLAACQSPGQNSRLQRYNAVNVNNLSKKVAKKILRSDLLQLSPFLVEFVHLVGQLRLRLG